MIPRKKVRAEFWAELIYEYDYPAHRIKVEVTIPDRVPTDRADIVIFSDDECKKPYALQVFLTDRFTVREILGRTVIIHAGVDDFTSQPAGSAGSKIACGRIVSSR